MLNGIDRDGMVQCSDGQRSRSDRPGQVIIFLGHALQSSDRTRIDSIIRDHAQQEIIHSWYLGRHKTVVFVCNVLV